MHFGAFSLLHSTKGCDVWRLRTTGRPLLTTAALTALAALSPPARGKPSAASAQALFPLEIATSGGGVPAAIVAVTMTSSVGMEGIPPRPPSRVVLYTSGSDLTIDVESDGQLTSMKAARGAPTLNVSLKATGRTRTILGHRCAESSFSIAGHPSGESRMLTTGIVWVAVGGPRTPANVSAPPKAAFGLPGGDFETFVALISRIGRIPCRVESETVLEGKSDFVEALKLPIRVTSVITALEGADATF